jgi:hypothetical protein
MYGPCNIKVIFHGSDFVIQAICTIKLLNNCSLNCMRVIYD